MFYLPPPFSSSSTKLTEELERISTMAVESRHLGFFPSHLLTNNVNEANPTAFFNNGNYLAPPLSGTTTETLHPIYNNNSVIADSLPVTSRKRSRDDSVVTFPTGSFNFLGEDLSLRIQHQQLEIEQFISQHTEKVKMEIEERRKRHARRILMAVEQSVMKKIRARDEEIENMGKLNWALEEKVKSLYMENQIWRDLAQTNEATVNTLRSNLEHVLSVVRNERENRRPVVDRRQDFEDEESCCGSNIGGGGGEEEEVSPAMAPAIGKDKRVCRNCLREEASVLLLPCRHLCLCSVCGSSVHICPVCKATKNASVHINLSSY
ncbi:probable BOI-related E3 ubiquitin-protein ligase 3 [Impatiens glandulifera]|uniref:probable BOI-related E3 ubiquitin-protein ligase 3 n=1 Tax=Impatiens glandulifera TaxID=253017 RepID=UPI001FB079C1|nr:probable BOI-related E3 ubiquitin-protein ligase 3 [Impatiens glandulifera]